MSSFFLRCYLALYSFLMAFAFIFVFPYVFIQRWRKKKGPRHLFEKFFPDFPPFKEKKGLRIWAHAVSLGETRALCCLMEKWKEAFPDTEIIISSVTKTGHEEAKSRLGFADRHLIFPFDFKWLLKPLLKKAKPDLVILSETDFWWNFLYLAKRQGSKIAVVNGKMSPKSESLWKKLPGGESLFSLIDLYCLQSEAYQTAFKAVGAPRDKVVITGNLKLDIAAPRGSDTARSLRKKEWGIEDGDLVVVLGSTHEGEELTLLESLSRVKKIVPRLKVLVVPRHPERFARVRSIMGPYPFATLVAEMGVLSYCYTFADAAIVGGSFVDGIGGHNLVEPTLSGVPVFFGRYTFSQKDLKSLVIEYGAGKELDASEVDSEITEFFQNPSIRTSFQEGARALIERKNSPTDLTWKQLVPLVLRKSEKMRIPSCGKIT